MADFAKCTAGPKQACPFKYSCKRFTAPAASHNQIWLVTAPYNERDHACPEFVINIMGKNIKERANG